jgi:hypothetical protein
VRTDSNGSGDFSDLGAGYTQAQLTAWAAEQLARSRHAAELKPLQGGPHAAGQAYQVVQRPCKAQTDPHDQGDLTLNPDSMAFHLIISRGQVVFSPERDGVRIIYTDGRPHPAVSMVAPMAGGHSVGHFEGDELVVDTVGMTPGPVAAGGWRTPQTHLTERFSVTPDGQHLSIRYTWTDPKVYVKPHRYMYTFDRLPAGSYAFEYWCDPSDTSQFTSIVPPKQQ